MVSQGNIWYTVVSQLAVGADDAKTLGVGYSTVIIPYVFQILNILFSGYRFRHLRHH